MIHDNCSGQKELVAVAITAPTVKASAMMRMQSLFLFLLLNGSIYREAILQF
jgi:hypothetical protein